jgi:transposase
VSFPALQPPVDRAPAGAAAGIDRGVATALVASGGQHFRAPRIPDRDAERYLALQQRFSRQARRSKRRERTRLKRARITARVTDRRKDWAEKASARLVRDHDLIVFEKLSTPDMTRKPKPKPDPEQPGRFLPDRRRQKAGLSNGILASARGALADRTQCGHHDHADTNAARNILARGIAAQALPAHARGQRAPRPRKTRQLAAGTTRSAE